MAEWNGVSHIRGHYQRRSGQTRQDPSVVEQICPSLHVKVDTAAVDSQTRDDESWGGGLYNVDGITSYLLS